MFEVNEELLKNVPLDYEARYSLEADETVLAFMLFTKYPGEHMEPKSEIAFSKCAVIIRYKNGYIELTDSSGMIVNMMGFLPTVIRDFARYHGIRGVIFVRTIEPLSLYINTSVNFEFIIPSNLIAKKYPDICIIANTSLVNVLTFTAKYDASTTDVVYSPNLGGKDCQDFPIATIGIVKCKNRIELSNYVEAANNKTRSIIMDIQHLITKYNDVNVSSIISLVKDKTNGMYDPYGTTADNNTIVPFTKIKDIKLKHETVHSKWAY